MRSTQLQTLKAIQAGAFNARILAERMAIPRSSLGNRLRILENAGLVRRVGSGLKTILLTPKGRAELDGES